MRKNRWTTFLLSILIIATLGCNLFSGLFRDKSSPVASAEPPALPSPPRPIAAIKGTPEEQAIFFADQLAVPETRLAGWLGLYDALGIPVIGEGEKAIGSTGDDPVGPQYWEVWYASEMDNIGRGISLSDAARILTAETPDLDHTTAANMLLRGFRESLQRKEPKAALLGELIRERIKRGLSKLDLADTTSTPDHLMIDMGMLELVTWVIIRDVVYRSIPRNTAKTYPSLRQSAMMLQAAKKAEESKPPCTARFGGDDRDALIEKVLIKNQDAVELSVGYAVGKFTIKLRQSLGLETKNDEKMKEAVSRLGQINLMLKFAFMLLGIEIASLQEPNPLERTKNTAPGKDGKIVWAVSSQKLPEGVKSSVEPRRACFLLYAVTNGINFEFPPPGRMADLRIRFEGKTGFTDLVTFTQRWGVQGPLISEASTNSGGEVTTPVSGSPQQRTLPDDSQPVDKEFSIRVSAVAERVGGDVKIGGFTFKGGFNSEFNRMWQSLSPVRWELGEYVFRLTDWRQRGYRASGQDGPVVYSGVICSLEQPFTVIGKHPLFPLPLNFTPSSPTTGTMSYGTSGSGISASGGGTYKIDGATTDTPVIVINTKSTASVPVVTTSGGGKATIFLLPLETGECN